MRRLLRWFPLRLYLYFVVSLIAAPSYSAQTKSANPKASRIYPGVVIDQIEITGAGAVKQSDLEPALEILPGDVLDEVKVERSVANFQEIYRTKGYPKTKIRIEVSSKKGEVTLDFIVTEGEAIRIGEIRFVQTDVTDRPHDDRKRELWASVLPDIRRSLSIHVGDVFDQDKIAEGSRAVQDILSSEYFIGSSMGDVRTNRLESPTPELKQHYSKTNDWVSLEVRISVGERVHFGFRGNHAFTNRELATIVEDQRALGFGRNYLEDIRVKTLGFYKSNGYPHASVEAYYYDRSPGGTRGTDKQATFVIDEGPRASITEIKFEGNQIFETNVLKKQFLNSAPTLVGAGVYVEKDVQKASELLVEWLKSQGYLASKLLSVHTRFVDTSDGGRGKLASITIYLYEGEQTIVESIEFKGLDQTGKEINGDELKDILKTHEGQPLNLFAFTDGLERVKGRFRELGHLDIRITNEGNDSVVQYSQRNRIANIRLEIDPGPKFRLGQVQIEGLQKTKPEVVEREIQVKPGEVMEEAKLVSTDARLRKLGLFSSIQVRPVPNPTSTELKDLVVSLQEGSPGLVGGGVGFRNDLGPRVFGFYEYGNLWGRNHAISFDAAVNRRFHRDNDDRLEKFRFAEYSAQLSYRWPWVFLGDTLFRPTLSLTGSEYKNFDAVTTALAATLERKIAQIGKVQTTGLLTYSVERVNQFNALDLAENRSLLIGSITPALRFDGRDNALAPTRGIFAYASYEYASPALGSQNDPYLIGYTRAQGRVDYTQPLPLRSSLYLSFRTGIERSTTSIAFNESGGIVPGSGSIPLSKRFALGGAGSLRGFLEQELNFQDERILGAISYVNYRTQLDLPFAGQMRFGPFLDAANLQLGQYSLHENLRFGYGVGFHYQTPVGPVNLDWGYKHKPRSGETRLKFYFSIGIL